MSEKKEQLKGHFKKHYDYRFLSADELTKDVTVTIESITSDLAYDPKTREKEPIVVMNFVGKEKGIVLNKTNAATVSENLETPDVEKWVGQKITLTTQLVSAFGSRVMAIRVKKESKNVKINR